MREGTHIAITMDASPWGMGAVITVNGRPFAFFGIPIDGDDLAMFGFERGDHRGQQTWETLVVLVALRHWSHMWKHTHAILVIRSDSVAALTAALKMKAKGVGTAIVASEIAFDNAEGFYEPTIVEHLPGIANDLADKLSRSFKPNVHYAPLSFFNEAVEEYPCDRPRSYYRCLSGRVVGGKKGKYPIAGTANEAR